MDYQLGPGPLQVDQNTTDEKIKGDIGIVENGDIATHAILKDYYVIWKGNLYKAKTDISSGTTLSAESNGNLDPKSNGLGGEVAALNSNITSVSFSSLASVPSGVSLRNVSIRKNVKVVSGYIEANAPGTESSVLGTISDSGHFPNAKVYFPMWSATSAKYLGFVDVSPSGVVTTHPISGLQTTEAIACHINYVVN